MSKNKNKKPAPKVEAKAPEVVSVALPLIVPNPRNPRQALDPARLRDLAQSMLKMGQLQPGVARPHPEQAGKYQLLSGHRRLQGLRAAGKRDMLLLVRDLDDRQALEVMVSENLHRDDLKPLEEAAGVKTLLDIGKDIQAIAADLGKSVGWVARRARLGDLHPKLRDLVQDSTHPLFTAPVEVLEMIAVMPAAVQESWTAADAQTPWRMVFICPSLNSSGVLTSINCAFGCSVKYWLNSFGLNLPPVVFCLF